MAEIDKMSFISLGTLANGFATNAINMRDAMNNVFIKFGEINEFWKGKQYNNLVMAMNNSLPELNENLKFYTYQIPKEIIAKVKSFMISDGQNINSINWTKIPEYTRIKELATTDPNTLKFKTENIKQKWSLVRNSFSNCDSYLEYNKKIIESINQDWESVSGQINSSNILIATKDLLTYVRELTFLIGQVVTYMEESMRMTESMAKQADYTDKIANGDNSTQKGQIDEVINKIKENLGASWKNFLDQN